MEAIFFFEELVVFVFHVWFYQLNAIVMPG